MTQSSTFGTSGAVLQVSHAPRFAAAPADREVRLGLSVQGVGARQAALDAASGVTVEPSYDLYRFIA